MSAELSGSTVLYCPACQKTYSPQEARAYGFLCPDCQINLSTRPVSVLELRPGHEWPGQQGGRYRLTGEIGYGGQAQVWRAEVTAVPPGRDRYPEQVALKIFLGRPERFEDMLEVYAHLTHQDIPHTMPLLDYGQVSRWTFLVFPFYSHGHVRSEILRTPQGSIHWDLLRRLVIHITDALAALHAIGIVHRDIKPSNILVDEQGGELGFILGDFGMATLHSVSGFRGTLLYAPPEAFLWSFREGETGEGAILPSWDWWSLGVTLAELIVGKYPFQELQTHLWRDFVRFWEQEFRRDMWIQRLNLPEAWAVLLSGLLTRNPESRWNHLQIRQWLHDPYSVPVPQEPQSLLVVEFEGRRFYSLQALAWAAWQHWEAAREHFITQGEWIGLAARLPPSRRTLLQRWMFQRERDEDARLAILLWALAPDLPLGLGAHQMWPTLEALIEALARPDDPLVQRLRNQGLFSAYFALTHAQAYEPLARRQSAGWVPLLQAWEKQTELRPLLLALWFSPAYFQQVRQSLLEQIEGFLQTYLCAPPVSHALQQAAQDLRQWNVEQPRLQQWEEVLRLVETQRQQALQQGLAVERTQARRTLDEVQQRLRILVQESIPGNEHTLQKMQHAQEIWQQLQAQCQAELSWPCWQFVQQKVLPFLETLSSTQDLVLHPRDKFERQWQEILGRSQTLYNDYVPLGKASRQVYQQLDEALQQAQQTPRTLEASLQRLELLGRLHKLLQDAQEGAWLPRREALQHLVSLQQKWRSRIQEVVWPVRPQHSYYRLRQELETWLQVQPERLSNLELSEFEAFLQERWRPRVSTLVTKEHMRIWKWGLFFHVVLAGLAGWILPAWIPALYAQPEIAVWQAWTWLIPLLGLFMLGSSILFIMSQQLGKGPYWRSLALSTPFIWGFLVFFTWLIWVLYSIQYPLEQALLFNLAWTLSVAIALFPWLVQGGAEENTAVSLVGGCCALFLCLPLWIILSPLMLMTYYPLNLGWAVWLLVIWLMFLFKTTWGLAPWLLILGLMLWTVLWLPEPPDDLLYPESQQTSQGGKA